MYVMQSVPFSFPFISFPMSALTFSCVFYSFIDDDGAVIAVSLSELRQYKSIYSVGMHDTRQSYILILRLFPLFNFL